MAERTSGNRTRLEGGATLVTLTSEQPGPTLALLGGVHGDEDEGVLAVHRLVDVLEESPFAGAVRAVAPANPLAWAAQSRTGPLDGENLARVFPGRQHGTPTDELALSLTQSVIQGADLLIDLHSAGVRYSMPLFCGFGADNGTAERSRHAAETFGAPLVWMHPKTAPGRSLAAAAALGIPAIYAECGGGGEIRTTELEAYVQGVLAVMADMGMTTRAAGGSPVRPRWVHGEGDLDDGAQSAHYGFFVTATSAGTAVGSGEEIGRVFSYSGQLLEIVRAHSPGIVMFLRRRSRVQPEDVLYVLAHLGDGLDA
ncbi:hypothetical protein FPZ12_006775 [Amycolatopsis acidicola]|uniref:Succinylglutamate desuccinylase/Aspartoacylase catalytic domain-containing protein n=1 Tax=Amycolatopsis acidicola TaxID=2596893 RepID=A0A5N0VJP4_9PSEU|nr:M14 family metallopeptidase [Amycolatopsis acidicola]KAA9164952.1 hypothetical protein FPZ12_006775 [Amycolatopsis acidicola]